MTTETETADAATAVAVAVAAMGDDSPPDQTPLTPPLPAPPSSGGGRDSSIKPERHSLTLDQRRALRSWASAQPTRPSHRACMDWFAYTYGQQISQSTVSHSLSPKYSRLDGDHPPLSGSRLRFGNWPDVEKLVLQWYQGSVAQGRSPTNEELGDKAKAIFAALPRYKGEAPPEFSPGWIHRFKKRYGLLVRRQRRHGSSLLVSGPRVPGIPGSASAALAVAAAAAAADGINPAEDIQYLADSVARYSQTSITPETSPAVVRQEIERVLGLETTLETCALVRDEILHRQANPQAAAVAAAALARQHGPYHSPDAAAAAAVDNDDDNTVDDPPVDASLYATTEPPGADSDDPEVVLQNALRAMQQEEAAAEATAAAAREERDRAERIAGHLATPGSARATAAAAAAIASTSARYTPSPYRDDVHVAPIQASSPTPLPPGQAAERPIRCPFCVNQRMLRSIREAVEHISTHVDV